MAENEYGDNPVFGPSGEPIPLGPSQPSSGATSAVGDGLPPAPYGYVNVIKGYDFLGRPQYAVEPDPRVISATDQARINASIAGAGLGASIAAREQGRQFDITNPQTQAQLAILNKQKQDEINQKNVEIAETIKQNQFLRTLQSFQANQGLTKEANDTTQRLFENQMTLQTMQNQRDNLQAQMQMQVAVENARNQLATQQANLQYQAQREARLQSLASDIGKLAADPGSRAQLAATLTANRAWGQAPTALRESQITDESLQPLQSDLTLQQQIQNQPAAPYQFTPIQAPQLPALNLGNIPLPQFRTTTPFTGVAPTATTASTPFTATDLGGGMVQSNANVGGASYQGAPIAGAWGTSGPAAPAAESAPAMAEGGVTRAPMFMVGDSKDGSPTGTEEVILNPGRYPISVVPNEMISRFQGSIPRYAEGTSFSFGGQNYQVDTLDPNSSSYQGTPSNPMVAVAGGPNGSPKYVARSRTTGVADPQTGWYTLGSPAPAPAGDRTVASQAATQMTQPEAPSARNFLAEALQKALAGTPWTASNLPTSVYASTPGTDPAVSQMLASLNAMARGVPAETFLRQASLLAPSGMSQGVGRRTG